MSNSFDESTNNGPYGSDVPSPDPGPQRHSKTPLLLLAVALVVALIVGGGGFAYAHHRSVVAEQHREQVAAAHKAKEKREAAAARKARLKRETDARRAAAAEAAAKVAEYRSCRDELDPFLEDLKTVNARLNVGITEATFGELVGAASVSHDQLDADTLTEIVDGKCLNAAASLETALNKYISAASTWNDCLYEDDYCTTDSIDPQLQRNWSAATRLIDRAEHKLDAADPEKVQTNSDSGSDAT